MVFHDDIQCAAKTEQMSELDMSGDAEVGVPRAVEELRAEHTFLRDDTKQRTLKVGKSGCFYKQVMGKMDLPKSALDSKTQPNLRRGFVTIHMQVQGHEREDGHVHAHGQSVGDTGNENQVTQWQTDNLRQA